MAEGQPNGIGSEEIPMLIHPDVKKKVESKELLEPRRVERLAYEYKVVKDEMLSILDKANEYFDVGILLKSPLYEKHRQNPVYNRILAALNSAVETRKSIKGPEIKDQEELQQMIRDGEFKRSLHPERTDDPLLVNSSESAVKDKLRAELAKEKEDAAVAALPEPATTNAPDAQDQPILPEPVVEESELQDFDDLFALAKIESDYTNYGKSKISLEGLALMMSGTEENLDDFLECISEAIDEKIYPQDREYEAKEADELKFSAMAEFIQISTILQKTFDTLLDRFEGFSEKEMAEIKTLGLSQMDQVAAAYKRIRKIRTGIRLANKMGNPQVAYPAEKTAKMYGTTPEKSERADRRTERILKKRYGMDVPIGFAEDYASHSEAVDEDFITAYVTYHRELGSLWALLNDGGIAETEDVKKIIEEAREFLQKNPPTIVYFHGDFGSGKTAIAKHIAKKITGGRPPIVVAGNKYLEPDKFLEEYRIQKLPLHDFLNVVFEKINSDERVDAKASTTEILGKLGITQNDMVEKINGWLVEDYRKNSKEVPENVRAMVNDQVKSLFGNSIQGQYVLGSMLTAMAEGVPLIIDEANAISPDVIIALNDYLTAKIGDKLQSNTAHGETEVKTGYCVMWTGNTGKNYHQARFLDIDPATLSRIHTIKVEYLPNSTQVKSMDRLAERLHLNDLPAKTFANEPEMLKEIKQSRELAKGSDQIFQVLLLSMMDRRKSGEFCVKADNEYSVIMDLYRLSIASRRIMSIYEGSESAGWTPQLDISKIIGGIASATELSLNLKHANVSMREMMDKVLSSYVDRGLDIEYHLFQYVKHLSQFPKEQAIIYAILQDTGFFKNVDLTTVGAKAGGTDQVGWPQIDSIHCQNIAEFQKLMAIDPINKIDRYERWRFNGDSARGLSAKSDYVYRFFSSVEMMQFLFGYLPPRKVAEYEGVEKKLQESKQEQVDQERFLRLIEQSRTAIAAIRDAAKRVNSKEIETERDRLLGFDITKESFIMENKDDLKVLSRALNAWIIEVVRAGKRLNGEKIDEVEIAGKSEEQLLNMAVEDFNKLGS